MSKYTKPNQNNQGQGENSALSAIRAYSEKLKSNTEKSVLQNLSNYANNVQSENGAAKKPVQTSSALNGLRAYREKVRAKEQEEAAKNQIQQPEQPQQKIYYGEDTISQFYDNSPNGLLYSQMFEYSEEYRNKMADMQVQRLQQKMQAAKNELEKAETRAQSMVKRSEELSAVAGNIEKLRLEYEETGDEVKMQAYLMATERYNQMVQKYNADLQKLQKDEKVYDTYNQAYVNYERARLMQEQRMAAQAERDEKIRADKLKQINQMMEEDPAAALVLAEADGRQISRTLEKLENEKAALIRTGEAVDWDAVDAINEKIKGVEALKEQKLRAEANSKGWNSSGEEFADRALNAIAAGGHSGLAGLAAAVDTVFNPVEYIVGTTLGNVADMLGSEDLKKTAEAWTQASKEYENAEPLRGQAEYYAEQATARAGKIDGWILNNLQSVGGMMFDAATMGMASAAGSAAGLTTGKIMAVRAAGNGMLDAAEKGYSTTEQLLVGVANGALEYISEKMFGGNPVYDAGGGFVTDALAKVIKNPKILRLMYSKGFDIAAEGLEEVFVELLQPVAEGMITNSDIDWASPADMANAFAGGVFISLLGSGAQVMVTEISGAGKAQRQAVKDAGTMIRKADAVQDLILEGLKAKKGTEAYELAAKMQNKLDSGETISTMEIGRLLMANQEAIEAGYLTEDAKVEPDAKAPKNALTDPEQGFYAIRIRKTEDGRNGYRLVHVKPDGSIGVFGQQTNDLFAAKTAAEIKGFNIRRIGTEQQLYEAAIEEEAEYVNNHTYEEERVDAEPETAREEMPELTYKKDQSSMGQVNTAETENTAKTGGIDWAGNDYGKGVETNDRNETAVDRRAQGVETAAQRLGQSGNAARSGGYPAGSEDQRKARRTESVSRRREEANRIRTYAADHGIPLRSAKDIGLGTGSDIKNLRVLPKGFDKNVDETVELIENAGLRAVVVSGPIQMVIDGEEQYMNGVLYNGVIYVQADSISVMPQQIAKHEVFHKKAADDPELIDRLWDFARNHYDGNEIRRRFNQYYEAYKDVYTDADPDTLRHVMQEELLADAYAEYERYGEETLPGLTEEAWEQAWGGRKNTDADSDEAQIETKFSFVGINDDGIEVYETSQKIMDLSWSERRAKYLDVMKHEYFGRTAKFERNGHIYYAAFDQSSIRKHIYGDDRSSDDGVNALIKAGADGDVFDLVERSKYTRSKPNTKDHTDADYFDYFVKTVQIDGKVFDLVADVEKKYWADGGYVYTLALVDNKKIKASPAHGTHEVPVKSAGNAFDNSVTQRMQDVKMRFSVVSEDVDEGGERVNPMEEVRFSLERNETLMTLAIEKNKETECADKKELEKAEKTRKAIASRMRKIKADERVALPEDVEGNTYIANSSYDGTEENTTICPRSLAAEAFVDAVSEYLGRPLTTPEQIYISQDLQGRTLTPECLYCYVATDRKAYRAFLGEWVKQRDDVLKKLKENPAADTSRKGALYNEFRNGRKDTENMYGRFKMWVDAYKSGAPMVEASHLANINKLMGDIESEFGAELKPQIVDAMKYAQAASWAKKRVSYVAYNGHILKWKQNRINKLNSHYGLRMYSFSDFHPAFVLENMQMITDASVRGLKMLGYTKDIDFVKIFAPTGMNINVSVFGFAYNGNVYENALQGASWEEAQKMREQYPNVGVTFVATNDEAIRWALAQEWIDVVIPYHLVRTGEEVAKALNYTNYTGESSDTKTQEWKKGDAKYIAPTVHNNDKEKYLEALKKNHLKPRFARFLDDPNYMKLVNECRQPASESEAVRPVFDEKAALAALDKLERDGYYQPIGGSVDRMYEIASEVGDKIYDAEKTGTVLKFSVASANKERDGAYMEAARSGDLETAQRMVDEYAIAKGFDVDEDGDPDMLFHGTDMFGFTKLDTSQSDDGTTFWATPNMGVAGSYYKESNYRIRNIGKEKVVPRGKKLTYTDTMEEVVNAAKPFASELGMDLSKVKYTSEATVMKKARRSMRDAVLAAQDVLDGDFSGSIKRIANAVIKASEQNTYAGWVKAINTETWKQYQKTAGINYAEIDLNFLDRYKPNRSDVSEATEADPDVFRMIHYIGKVLDDLELGETGTLRGETLAAQDILNPYNDLVTEKGIYSFYHKQDNAFVYNCNGAKWDQIEVPEEAKDYFSEEVVTTRQLAAWAFANGYDAIRLDEVVDVGGYALKEARKPATVWAFKNPQEQLKSADPVTYDDNGKIIPLSKRFNTKNNDIRYSAPSEDKARRRAEKNIANGIGRIMSMPTGAVRKLQSGIIQELLTEYQQTGEIDADKLSDAVATAFAEGLVANNEFYETYKPVKEYLRTTAVAISEQDQADIADFAQFKKKAFGTLRIVREGGMPVDAMYQEVREMAPGLLNPVMTHPADQLVQLYEKAKEIRKVEIPLERAMGEQADQFYEWAEGQILKLLEKELTKYADSVQWENKKTPERRTLETDAQPDTYDRANEQMFDYGQQRYYEWPEPGSGVVQEDYIYPEEGGLEWAGQMRTGNWVRDQERKRPEGRFDERTVETEEETGQFVVDEFVPELVVEEELTEEEKARRGTMREWIQYVMRDGVPAEEFAERMRNSARGPLKGGAKVLADRMEETAKQKRGDQENLYRDPELTDEEYEKLNAAWKAHQEQKASAKQRETVVRKKDFESTPAMDKLGIKIDGSVTRYRATDMLRGYEKAAREAQQMLNKRLKKMNASQDEIMFGKMLADGIMDVNSLNYHAINIERIAEIADYYMAKKSFDDDRLYQRKAEINQANDQIAKNLLTDRETFRPHLSGKLQPFTKMIMNERTPERVIKQIFGAEQGEKIFEFYFRPVWVNGNEMIRFKNRLLRRAQGYTDDKDTVGGFYDQDGKRRQLTEKEWEVAQRILEGKAVAEEYERLKEDAKSKIAKAARALNDGMSLEEASEKYDLADGYEQGIAQAYADYLDINEIADKMDRVIMENAVKIYQKIYNEFYDAYNDFLVSHGFEEIGFIKNYAPHFQKKDVQHGLRAALRSVGVTNDKVTELPSEIAGRTADFKPSKKWNPHSLERKGSQTDYHLLQGFQQYLDYAAEVFYHTDDVMRLRSAVKFLRGQYAAKEISAEIEDAFADMYKPVKWKEGRLKDIGVLEPDRVYTEREVNAAYETYTAGLLEKVSPESLSKWSEFTTWMENAANIIAGKQSVADRGTEFEGRLLLNIGSRMASAFAKANVAGNISSVLNQTAQVPLLQVELGKYLEMAAVDIAKGGADADFVDHSDFLTEKKGVDVLTTDNVEKFVMALFKPAQMMDGLVSKLAVRGRFLKALDEGMTDEEAMRAADDFGRRIMGSRMKGIRPQGFESKKPWAKMIHVFQLEGSNVFDYMLLSDMPQAVQHVAKTKGKKAAQRYVATTAAYYLMSAAALNAIVGSISGGSPAPFDIIGWLLTFVAGGWGRGDEEFLKTVIDNGTEKLFGERVFDTKRLNKERGFDWAGAVKNAGYDVVNDIPFVSNVAGVMGWGDQTMPTVGINEMAEDLWSGVKTIFNQITGGEEKTGLDWAGAVGKSASDILNALSQAVPGGRQAKKTLQAARALILGGRYSGFGKNKKLMYTVDRGIASAAQGLLFGPSAWEETDDYYAGGKMLTAAQTQKAEALRGRGVDLEDTYKLYQDFSEINEELSEGRITSIEAKQQKRDLIAAMDLTDEQKMIVYMQTLASGDEKSKEKAESKYIALLQGGVSWAQITDLENEFASFGEDADGDGERDMDSVDYGIARRNAIAAMDLNDWQRLEVFDQYMLDKNSDSYESTRAELETMLDEGLTWDDVTDAHNTYAMINADDTMNATQKATAYAKWADEQGWTDAQIEAVKERYTFWQMFPAEATSYEKFSGAGLSADNAAKVVEILSALEPEAGKKSVSDVQRIEAIANGGFDAADTKAAMRSVLSESQAETFDDLMKAGLTPKQYAQYRRAMYGLEADKDANGKPISGSKKKKVLNAIDRLPISDDLKTELYFVSGYGESTLKDAPWK